MKFKFPEKDTEKVIELMKENLSGRKLGEMVSLDKKDDGIVVTISKLGTSTLEFTKDDEGGFALASEKIAFAHRMFKDEVTQKICQIIEKCGGEVS
jgi:hypothetical protein